MSDFEKLKDKLKDKLTKVQSSQEVETVRSEIFGKNGLINLEFKKIGSLSPIFLIMTEGVKPLR